MLDLLFIKDDAMLSKSFAHTLCLASLILIPMNTVFANTHHEILKKLWDTQDKPTITELSPEEILHEAEITPCVLNLPQDSLPDSIEDTRENEMIGTILQLGLSFWHLIMHGKPTCQTENTFASGLPSDMSDWRKITGWEAPTTRAFRITYKNVFGMELVHFIITAHYIAKGHYQNGLYLTNVSVRSPKVDVIWTHDLRAKVEIPQVYNIGTEEEPIAAMQILVSWTIRNPFRVVGDSVSFLVRGDGTFTTTSLPFIMK
jgi:hypothetical protein